MNKKVIYNTLVVIGAITLLIYGFIRAFDPEVEIVSIKQDIGGELICKSVYYPDQHSWHYAIDYSYVSVENDTMYIGAGNYNGRYWEKDEQIMKFQDWLILKTGTYYNGDKLLIANSDSYEWKEFEISPRTIEKDSTWISMGIISNRNFLPNEALIEKIENGIVTVDYLHRKNSNTNETVIHTIIYKINELTGDPVITKIKI